jgi:aminoglycoside phosphotransferase (APT) family kinase protein
MRPLAVVANMSTNVSREEVPAGVSLREFVQASGLRSLVLGTSKDPNAKITILLVSPETGRPVLAIKTPTTDEAARAVEAEARMLIKLSSLQREEPIHTIPEVVDVVEFEGRPAVVTTAIRGTPMMTSYFRSRHTASRERVRNDFAAVERWLAHFQGATAVQLAPLDMDGRVTVGLRERFSEEERIDVELDRLAELYARLRQNSVPRTAVHGDFWFGNVLLVEGQVAGVVDWEAGAISGEPVRDLVRFALMYALYLEGRTKLNRRVAGHPGLRTGEWGAGVEYAINGTGWFPELFQGFLCDGLERLGASPLSWRDAALAGIAEVAALTDHQEFARRHFELFRQVAIQSSEGLPNAARRGFSGVGPSAH